jgi:alpha-aminoadipate carrier protein LysW
MPTSICPDCSEEVYVDADCEQGDTVNCDECGSKLVVVGLDPVELDVQDESESESGALDSYDFDEDRY